MTSIARAKPCSDLDLRAFFIKWTPRVVAVAIGGYYGLGIAYECGLMALIDRVAIQVLKYFLGYAGVGALMPSVQWYAAWGARIAIGFAVGLTYDLAEKIALCCYHRCTLAWNRRFIK